MSLGGFFKKLGKGIAETVYRPVRGIARVATGDFRRGLGDIGFGIKRGAQAAALLSTGGMYAPALLAAGGGMLERATQKGAGFKNVVGAGLGGAAGAYGARGLGDIGRAGLARIGTSGAGNVAGTNATTTLAGGGPPYVPGGIDMTALRPPNPNLLTAGGASMPTIPADLISKYAPAKGSWLGSIGKGLQRTGGLIERNPTTAMLVGQGILASQDDPMVDIAQQNQDRLNEQWAMEQDPQYQRRKMIEQMILSGAWRSR